MKKIRLIGLLSLVAVFFAACSSEEARENTDSKVVIEEVEDGQLITYESGLRVKLKDGKYFLSDDVVLSEDQIQIINDESKLRTGLISPISRWPNRTVPYRFRDGDFDETAKNTIRSVWHDFNTRTCIVVREATAADRDYILVTNENSGPWSYLGRIGGQQQMNLQHNSAGTSLTPVILTYTMLTALGTIREFRRPDRDEYLQIYWENLQPGTESFFDKYPWAVVSHFGVDFNYHSVTLPEAGKYFLTKNGQPTMQAIGDPSLDLKPSNGLSELDILSLNRMYACE